MEAQHNSMNAEACPSNDSEQGEARAHQIPEWARNPGRQVVSSEAMAKIQGLIADPPPVTEHLRRALKRHLR